MYLAGEEDVVKPPNLPGRTKTPRTPQARSAPRGNSSEESARSSREHGRRRDGTRHGEDPGIIAAGRCAVPGGEGEGPCRDLPSPGHGRDALPELSRPALAARASPRGRSRDLLRSFSPIAVQTALPTLRDGSRRCLRMSAPCLSFPACKGRCSVTLTKHPEIQTQPIIPHPTPPSRASESFRGFFPPVGIAPGREMRARLSSARSGCRALPTLLSAGSSPRSPVTGI